MSKRKVKIVQAGITSHGVTILNAIKAAPNLELVSVFDIRSDEVKRVSKELGIHPASSFEELVSIPEVEAIALVTPNHLHAGQVSQAVKQGKHVFVEKPLAPTVREAKRMIKETEQARLVMMVGHNTRRRRVFRRAKEILAESRLGTIVAIEMNVSRPAGLFADLPAWKADPKITALLPMTQLGIHFIDTVHYLFETKTVRVGCIARNIAMKGGAHDSTISILELGSGIPATLSCYYSTPDVYYIKVYGTDGILDCQNSSLKLQLLRNGVLQTELEEDYRTEGYASFEEEMREFGSCVSEGAEPETGGEEGLQALAVIEGMVQSLNSNAIVNINDILKGD